MGKIESFLRALSCLGVSTALWGGVILFGLGLTTAHTSAQYVIVAGPGDSYASADLVNAYLRSTIEDLGLEVLESAEELERGEFGTEVTVGVMELSSGGYDVAFAMSNVMRLDGGMLYRHRPAIYHLLHEQRSLKEVAQGAAEELFRLIRGADSGPWGDYWRSQSGSDD